MGTLDDLLNSYGNATQLRGNTENGNNKKPNTKHTKAMLHACCDVVLQENGNKYILGTNQLFPICTEGYIGVAGHDIMLYVYTALRCYDYFYTDYGRAIKEDEDPEAFLGYDCGIDVLKYKNTSPCLVGFNTQLGGREERGLTIDGWCRLTANSTLVPAVNCMPTLWRPDPGGLEFWTPDQGLMRALPVKLPMCLSVAEDFCKKYCEEEAELVCTRLSAMVAKYMRELGTKNLYIGYNFSLSAVTETQLIPAAEWSATHARKVGIFNRTPTALDSISRSADTALVRALRSGVFSNEALFV